VANSEAAAGTPAEPTNAPQAGTPETPEQEAKPQAGEDTLSLDDARKLRSEAASMRRRLREFEDAKRQQDEASLSEAEKLKKRVTELEESERTAQAAVRTLRIRSAVEREAAKRHFADPADAYSLVGLDAIELDDGGEPTNVGKLLDRLVASKPYLVQAQPTANGTPPPAPVTATPRPTNGREVTEAARRQDEIDATHHVGQLWGRAPRR
jgi:hypothetical protein